MSNYIDNEELACISEIVTTLNEMTLEAKGMFGQIDLFDANGEKLCVIEMIDNELVILVGS